MTDDLPPHTLDLEALAATIKALDQPHAASYLTAVFTTDLPASLAILQSGGDESAYAAAGAPSAAAIMATLAVAAKAGPPAMTIVDDAVASLVRTHVPVMKALTAALAKAEKALAKARPLHAYHVAQWLTTLLLLLAVDLPGTTKAVDLLAKMVGPMLDLAHSDDTPGDLASRVRGIALRLLQGAATIGSSSLATTLTSASASSHVLAATCAQLPDAGSDLARSQAQYVALVLTPKARPAPAVVSVWSSWLASLEDNHWMTETILPGLSRMSKRAPEVVLVALAQILQARRRHVAWVGLVLAEVGGAVASALKHADPVRRGDAAQVWFRMGQIGAWAPPDAATTATEIVYGAIESTLKEIGTKGTLKATHEKEGVVLGLTDLALGLLGDDDDDKTLAKMNAEVAATLAAQVVPVLTQAVVDETNKATRAALMQALPKWTIFLARGGQPLPPNLPAMLVQVLSSGAETYTSGAGDGDEVLTLRGAACVAAAEMAAASTKHAETLGAAGALPALVTVVREGLAKPTARGDAIAALLGVGTLGSVLGTAEDEQIWMEAVTPTSRLLEAGLMETLNAGQLPLLMRLAQEVLVGPGVGARRARDTHGETLRRSVVRLLLHGHAHGHTAVRSAAERAIRDVANHATTPRDVDVTTELLDLVRSSSMESLSSSSQSRDDPPNTGRSTAPLPLVDRVDPDTGALHLSRDTMVRVLLHISPVDATWPATPAGLAGRMLVAFHPRIARLVPSAGEEVMHPWSALGTASGPGQGCRGAVADQMASVVTCLQEQGLAMAKRTDDASLMSAAIGSLAACVACAGHAAWPAVEAVLRDLLDRADHDALTPMDRCIFATPPGSLATETDDGRALVLAERTATTLEDGDEERASAVKLPLKKGEKPNPQAERKAQQLARESFSRTRTARIVAQLEAGCDLVDLLGRLCPHVATVYLETLSDAVIPYLDSQLGEIGTKAARRATAALCRCLPPTLAPHAETLCAAIAGARSAQRPSPHRDIMLRRLAEDKHLKQAVDVLHAATCGAGGGEEDGSGEGGVGAGGRHLPPAAFALCFHVLEAVLALPDKTKMHGPAIAVITLHASPTAVLPRARLFRSLYRYLHQTPAAKAIVAPLLQALAQGADQAEDVSAGLEGLTFASPHVRAVALATLARVPGLSEGLPRCSPTDWVLLRAATHDISPGNATFAAKLWEQAGAGEKGGLAAVEPEASLKALLARHSTDPVVAVLSTTTSKSTTTATKTASAKHRVIPCLFAEAREVRRACGAVLHEVCSSQPSLLDGSLAELVRACSVVPEAPAAVRAGCGVGLESCAPDMQSAHVLPALSFLLSKGLADGHAEVRPEMLAAAIHLADVHGPNHAAEMIPVLERAVGAKSLVAANEDAADLIREGAIVMLGTIAKHLPHHDAKVKEVLDALVAALATPSESVQRSCAQCLAPLIQAITRDGASSAKPTKKKDSASPLEMEASQLLHRLIEDATRNDDYATRRGAAFGVAGMVRGLGLMSIKREGLMATLTERCESKKDTLGREGALYCFAALTEFLGRLFEPYVIVVLPLLLSSFADGNKGVQEAARVASRAIMGQLTAHGIRLVLPAILRSLEDPMWRTKQGAVQLLASMAYCAPKQLGSALPKIVPKLGDVLSDPHPKVIEAAREALAQVGGTIQNPEIREMANTLLEAISGVASDPRLALDRILQTTFVHTVDAASLALVIPVLSRSLRSPVGDVKRRAARILGSLCGIMTDPHDMVPYLPSVQPSLFACTIDAGPEVRATSAKALGALVRYLGEDCFPDLVASLMSSLQSDASAVERQGAAQGLAEVLQVLGVDRLGQAMPAFVTNTRSRSPHVREGHIVLLRYLPMAIGAPFQPFLEDAIACILPGLADEVESVREAALKAGRTMVDLFAATSLNVLLPSVSEALFSHDARIRQASVELLGALLFSSIGSTRKFGAEADAAMSASDEFTTTAQPAQGHLIEAAIGTDVYHDVLARLFIARADVALAVRSASMQVWKALVDNTPRALQAMLDPMLRLSVDNLGHHAEERREMCSRAVGEMVRKLGDRVVRQAMPVLSERLKSSDPAMRRGACLGLREVLDNMTRNMLTEHLTALLPTIQEALTDNDDSVREAAGGVLGSLFKGGGGTVVESVVPALLRGLDTGDAAAQQKALEGLQVILSVKPSTLAHMAVRLLVTPLHAERVDALASLAVQATPQGLESLIHDTLVTLLTAASSPQEDPDVAAACQRTASRLLVLVEDPVSVGTVLHLLSGRLEHHATRLAASRAAAFWPTHTKAESETILEQAPAFFGNLVPLWGEEEEEVRVAGAEAAQGLLGVIGKETFPRLVRPCTASLRSVISLSSVGSPPGLGVPKGVLPLAQVLIQGLLQATSSELRLDAAEGLADLIGASTPTALKPHVLLITGPLIRIIGDRFPPELKAAILRALGLMVDKGGVALRPFVPQLQTSFFKCLLDEDGKVRGRAAANLGELAELSARFATLATDLTTHALQADRDSELPEGYLRALRGLLHGNAGAKLPGDVLATVQGQLVNLTLQVRGDTKSTSMGTRAALAGCLGALVGRLESDVAADLLDQVAVSVAPAKSPAETIFTALVWCGCATFAPTATLASVGAGSLAARLVDVARTDCFEAREMLGVAVSGFGVAEIQAEGGTSGDFVAGILPALTVLLAPDMYSSVQINACRAVKRMAAASPGALRPHVDVVAPHLLSVALALSGLHKVYAERALGGLLEVGSGMDVLRGFAGSAGCTASMRAQLGQDVYAMRLQRLVESENEEENDEFDSLGL